MSIVAALITEIEETEVTIIHAYVRVKATHCYLVVVRMIIIIVLAICQYAGSSYSNHTSYIQKGNYYCRIQ